MIRHVLIVCAVAALSACATDASSPAPVAMGGPTTPMPATSQGTRWTAGRSCRRLRRRTGLRQGGPGLFRRHPGAQGQSAHWKLAIQDNDLWQGGALKHFACAMGTDITEKGTPATWKILHRIEVDVRTIGTPAKDFFKRDRP